MKCEYEGCTKEATVKCVLLAMEEGEEDLYENLCAEHAAESGYCICCGHFWAGCSSYDFSPVKGVCENCICEFEEPDYEDNFYFPDDY